MNKPTIVHATKKLRPPTVHGVNVPYPIVVMLVRQKKHAPLIPQFRVSLESPQAESQLKTLLNTLATASPTAEVCSVALALAIVVTLVAVVELPCVDEFAFVELV